MADISKIKLPNGTTYNIKDNNALPLTGGSVTGPVSFGDSVSIDEATIGDLIVNGNSSFVQGVKANQIVPFKSKTFTDVIGTENNWAKATFFFGSIKPTTWYALWKIKFNIHIYAPGKDTYHQISEVMMSGDQGALRTYSSMNTVANQLVYYGVLYRLKSAGFTNGYGHSIGCRFYSSNYPTDTNYKRTIVVDILETENCTFDFYDSCLLYANIPGTGTTNYDTYSEINWCSNGLQEAGDSDTTDDRQIYFGGKTSTSKGIWAGSLFMEDGEGTYQNICAASDGTITASNRTTATTKIANTSGFKIGGKVYYSNTNYNPNTNISGWGVVHNTISLFDTRYAFNTTLTAGSLTAYKPLYLVGTISNGLFYLDSTYYTQTPTITGKIYILVGGVYDSTTSNCRMGLYQHNPWYYYDGSKLVPYVGNAQTINGYTVNANVPSGAKFTDTVTTATTTGSGNAVTSITASNGALTVTKGTTFLTSHQDISGKADKATTLSGYGITDAKIANGVITLGSNTITPLTSHNTYTISTTGSGNAVTAVSLSGTTFTVTKGATYSNNSGTVTKVTAGTGLSIGTTAQGNFTTSGTINHTNSVTAQTTQAIYPIKIDAQGHISGYGSAVTIPTKTSQLTNDSGFITNAGVTGVKGNSESTYRTGQVNLTAANIGAAASSHTHSANDLNGGYINIHPENGPVIIPFIHNDIAHLLKRGGSVSATYDNNNINYDFTSAFDGSGSYVSVSSSTYSTLVITVNLHKQFTWTNTVYIDFGSTSWRAKSVKIEVINSNYTNDVWTQKYNTTTNGLGHVYVTFTHTPVGASNAGGGYNKIRFTLSDFNSTDRRIAQIGVYFYGSLGVRETYMSRGADDYVFRNITPNNNNTYNLGSSSYKWANVYATTLTGNVTGTATGNLTSVQYDSTNSKLTYTKNGSNTDIVTVAALKSALGSMPASDVYSWAKASTKPTYTASEVGALASNTTYVSTITTTAGTHSAISSKSGAVSFNVPTKTSHLTNDSNFVTSSGVTSITLKAGDGISLDTDNTAITTTGTRTISHADTSSQASSSNSGRTYIQSITLDGYGHVTGISTATESVTNTDTKLQVAAVTSGTTYYPIVGTGTTAATRQYDTTGFIYVGTNGTANGTNGNALLTLGNSTASTTANWKKGTVRLYGTTAYYTDLVSGAPSANRTITFPNKTGTLLLVENFNEGTSTSSSTFYAPTSAGTSGYYLKSNGSGSAPTWTAFPTIPTNTDAKVTQTADSGSSWRKILTSYNSGSAATTSITSGTTNTSYYNNNVSIQPSTGSMYIGGSYYMYLNASTSDALYSAINDLGWTSDVIE